MLSFEVSAIDLILAIGVTILLVLHIPIVRSTKNENPSKKPTGIVSAEAVKIYLSRFLPNLPSLLLIALGLIVLVWVGWLIWYDVTTWGKDIALIFFGSRMRPGELEAISLGIGMKVFDYFLIGLTLPLLGLFVFLRRRIYAK